ncbi:hypothetical protein B0T14DRAFT_430533 [Immersiella caudata]|uniref:peptidylprolyl isomerase n=1 Tax=Immersiella caudata TaxID=314043 RepID=A0AA39WRL0_9PEZI|nr:hypothetical protein B0T14DRAFT_430533 [Immersiella caudata]
MGVRKTVIVTGTGSRPRRGQTVTIEYTGWLKDDTQPDGRGELFDSSVGREDLETVIGVGNLIKGWDEAVPLMRVGERAILEITSDYGYGERGFRGHIPRNADLIL